MQKDGTYKLQSFTLLEITIAMLLVAILSAFAYYAFQTFLNISTQEQHKKRDRYMVELFFSRMTADWANAEHIGYSEGELRIRDTVGEINYRMQDSLILREQYALQTDSFFLRLSVQEVQWLQKEGFQTPLLQNLLGFVYFKGQTIPIELTKSYSATQILNSTKANLDDTN